MLDLAEYLSLTLTLVLLSVTLGPIIITMVCSLFNKAKTCILKRVKHHKRKSKPRKNKKVKGQYKSDEKVLEELR
jgi:hypothetical protein